MIPNRVILSGDRNKAAMYISSASSQMKILEELMAFQKINTDFRTVHPEPGVVIECYSSPGVRDVKIHVESSYSSKEDKKPDWLRECFCNCGLAIGQITNYMRNWCYDCMDDEYRYDVLICVNKETYVIITDATPMVMYPYRNGQPVLVMYEPNPITAAYSVGSAGCHISVTCRISTINNDEPKYTYYAK